MNLKSFFKFPASPGLVAVDAICICLMTLLLAVSIKFASYLLLDPSPTNVLLGKAMLYAGPGSFSAIIFIIFKDMRRWMSIH